MLIKEFTVLSMFLELSSFLHGYVGGEGGGAIDFLFGN